MLAIAPRGGMNSQIYLVLMAARKQIMRVPNSSFRRALMSSDMLRKLGGHRLL